MLFYRWRVGYDPGLEPLGTDKRYTCGLLACGKEVIMVINEITTDLTNTCNLTFIFKSTMTKKVYSDHFSVHHATMSVIFSI